jgi:site-specific DNA-cytosine methylase
MILIPTLDLFSGIGGFSYALNSIAKTVAYCDINPDCHDVLHKLMDKNLLDKAPIFTDITSLKGTDLKKFKPKMLTAGFPCTDISAANNNPEGIDGEYSGLFFEIMRILDETPSISYVLLENSPMIRTRGLPKIRDELKKRGFKLVWGYFEARMVGALHKRKRWICFAFKRLADDLKYIDNILIKFDWKQKNIKRLIKKNDDTSSCPKRCSMLGNSVVPQIIRYAWNTILKNAKMNILGNIDNIDILVENNSKIILSDGANNLVEKNRWATPTFTTWHQYRRLTDRSTRILGNQIYYEKKTVASQNIPINMRDKYYRIDPNFIEYLMGYPKKWTEI